MSEIMSKSAKTKKLFELLDELESVVNTSSRLPLSDKGVIDVALTEDLLKDIRLAIPREMHEAAWLVGEKNRITHEAEEEYNKVIKSANDEAEHMIENNVITKEAQKRAKVLIAEAEKNSTFMKLKCYEHIDKMLYDLQNSINSTETSYIEPMRDYMLSSFREMQDRIGENRNQMRALAKQINQPEIDKDK